MYLCKRTNIEYTLNYDNFVINCRLYDKCYYITKIDMFRRIKMFKRLLTMILIVIGVLTMCSCNLLPKNILPSSAEEKRDNIDGFEYAPFEKYNSYASDNGLGNTKVYIIGEVTKIDNHEGASYGIVKTNDGEWNIIFGLTSSEELKQLYLNKNIYAFGLYTGYSNVLKSPSIMLERVQCDGNTKLYNQLSDLAQITEPQTSNDNKSSNSYKLETSQIDYHTLSKKEFADKVAKDFSTTKVTFEVDAYSDLTYFLKPKGTTQLINADIGFFDFGYEICLTLPTNGDTNECIEILTNGLKSDLFGISFDDQIDIIARYKVDEVKYESNGIQPFTIKETKSEKFNMLFFNFKK